VGCNDVLTAGFLGILERPTPPGSPDVGRPSLEQGPELARHAGVAMHVTTIQNPCDQLARPAGVECMGRHRVLNWLKLPVSCRCGGKLARSIPCAVHSITIKH